MLKTLLTSINLLTHYAIGIVFPMKQRFTITELYVSGSFSLPLGFFSTFPSGTLHYRHIVVLSLGLCQNIAYLRFVLLYLLTEFIYASMMHGLFPFALNYQESWAPSKPITQIFLFIGLFYLRFRVWKWSFFLYYKNNMPFYAIAYPYTIW